MEQALSNYQSARVRPTKPAGLPPVVDVDDVVRQWTHSSALWSLPARRSQDCVDWIDRKSTRLNSSHRCISYAVFCLKKKTKPRAGSAEAGIRLAAVPAVAADLRATAPPGAVAVVAGCAGVPVVARRAAGAAGRRGGR